MLKRIYRTGLQKMETKLNLWLSKNPTRYGNPYQLRRRSVSIDLRSVYAICPDLKMSKQSSSICFGKTKSTK